MNILLCAYPRAPIPTNLFRVYAGLLNQLFARLLGPCAIYAAINFPPINRLVHRVLRAAHFRRESPPHFKLSRLSLTH